MKRIYSRWLLGIVIAGTFAASVYGLLQPDSKPPKPPATPPVPVVDVARQDLGNHSVTLAAHGSVKAAELIEVRPDVGGRILSLHPDFEPGGLIPAEQTLLRIDPADYELAVAQARADVARAEADIQIELGKSKVAREEIKLLQNAPALDAQSRALTLRKPQLAQVRATLAGARSQLDQAELELQRTTLALPYAVVVLERQRVAGEVVAARELIGQVARADRFWVELRVSPAEIRNLQPENSRDPITVDLNANGESYGGHIIRVRADLAADTRLAGVLVEVGDPLGLKSQHAGRQPLLIGSYVRARIDAGIRQHTLKVPSHLIRDNQRLWVVDADDRLQVREIQALGKSGTDTLLRPTLEQGDRILVGSAKGLIPGSAVRVRVIDD